MQAPERLSIGADGNGLSVDLPVGFRFFRFPVFRFFFSILFPVSRFPVSGFRYYSGFRFPVSGFRFPVCGIIPVSGFRLAGCGPLQRRAVSPLLCAALCAVPGCPLRPFTVQKGGAVLQRAPRAKCGPGLARRTGVHQGECTKVRVENGLAPK